MTISVRNPRTGRVDYEFEPSSRDEVAAKAKRLRENQTDWYALGFEGRSKALVAWSNTIENHKEKIIDALAVDTGRYYLSKREVEGAVANIRRWAKNAPGLLKTEEKESQLVSNVSYDNQYVPYELSGFISPWNFPVTLSLIDAAPALAAGSTALIKPSEVTPRFAEYLLETIQATPEIAGVVDLVLGDGAVGAALIDEVDLICFTGSIATGRKVASSAAANFIPAFLELGGKDPVIVLKDANIDKATDSVLRGSIMNAGQVCLSIERIYVQEDIHDAFVEMLVGKAEDIELNTPDIHQGQVGPLIFDRQADVIAAHIADAKAKGAKILCGGEIEDHGGGKWVRPTILTHVTHDMDIMSEETFGPMMPVMAFQSVDEAVMLANDTTFGLSASVIGADVAQARAVAERVNAGGLSINDCGLTFQTYEPEKTSFNMSGLGGSRMGPGSIYRFMRKKALIMQHGQPRRIQEFGEPVQA